MDVLSPEFRLLWVPCPDAACAEHIGREAVEHHLAACANILPGMRSIYRWNGAVQSDAEILLVLKTSRERAGELTEFVVSRHPYELPAVSILPLAGGHAPFLEWVGQETSAPGEPRKAGIHPSR